MCKNIAVIIPKFRGYESRFIKSLESLSYNVDYVILDEKKTFELNNVSRGLLFILRVILNIFFSDVKKNRIFSYIRDYFFYSSARVEVSDSINSKLRQKYDYLIVIKGWGVTEESILKIDAKEKILYQWDSIDNYYYIVKIYNSFDKIFTFDKHDACQGFGMHLEMFSLFDGKKEVLKNKKEKIFFIGDYTKERYELLILLSETCNRIGLEFDFELISEKKTADFIISNMIVTLDDYYKRLESSTILLDIIHAQQNGETQRYADSKSLHKKYIKLKCKNNITLRSIVKVKNINELISYSDINNNNNCVVTIEKWILKLIK